MYLVKVPPQLDHRIDMAVLCYYYYRGRKLGQGVLLFPDRPYVKSQRHQLRRRVLHRKNQYVRRWLRRS